MNRLDYREERFEKVSVCGIECEFNDMRIDRAHCYYLMALGNMGLGDPDKASAFLARAAAVEPSHMMCRVYQTQTAAQTLPVSQRGLMKR